MCFAWRVGVVRRKIGELKKLLARKKFSEPQGLQESNKQDIARVRKPNSNKRNGKPKIKTKELVTAGE